MPDPFDRPLVSPIMVGRDAHLAALKRCIDGAADGTGQTVLVTGDAGIGKSRLIASAASYARGQGMRVLTAQCFEPDRALPFAPWRDLISSHLVRQDWATEILVDVAPDLVTLVPGLARLMPDARLTSAPLGEPEQRRIVAALTRMIEQLVTASPPLLVVEDVHWSDEASLDLLLSVARLMRDGEHPAILCVSYRSDTVS